LCTVPLAPHSLVVRVDCVVPVPAACLAPESSGSVDPISDRPDSGGSAPGSTPVAGQAAPGLSRSAAPAFDVPRTEAPPIGPGPGHGIRGARERVEAAGGTLTVTSPPGGGTHVEVQW